MPPAASLSSGYQLAAGYDPAALADRYRQHGRVRIRGLLARPEPLADYLHARTNWRQMLNAGDKVYELDRQTRADMAPERRGALDEAVYAGAREGFQFRYEAIRVTDDAAQRAADPNPLSDFAAWLSTGPMRDFLRAVVGAPAIDFADAQATSFGAGDFLTGHDDAVEGKNRVAAYVFGLTPNWRLEWGGLLMFHPDRGDECAAMIPAFNTLDLFTVPVPHSVSLVSPAAPVRRTSVTGWLRTR